MWCLDDSLRFLVVNLGRGLITGLWSDNIVLSAVEFKSVILTLKYPKVDQRKARRSGMSISHFNV